MRNCNFTPFYKVQLKDGFWKDRYNLNKNVSIPAVKMQFEDTARFDAMRFNYLKTGKWIHYFYDSDVAKWIEGVSYLLERHREELSDLEKFIDELVDCMAAAQRDDGYLNAYHQQIEPQNIFKDRTHHELYCSGHLIEAAIAYHHATGKGKFLEIMEKNCECIERAFFTEKTAAFCTPGHEEIELALFKLWHYTGKEKYRVMAEGFLTARGNSSGGPSAGEEIWKPYAQDRDIYSLEEAEGHSVRALYLYCGIADMALANGDDKLKKSLDAVWSDLMDKKSYITGGLGSTYRGEAFTTAYDLPNDTAYAESCAAIALCFFAMRMRRLEKKSIYGAAIERELYNNALSSASLDGKAFYYTNPLELALENRNREQGVAPHEREYLPATLRQEVFGCSCCPPNINRFFASFPEMICFEEEDCAVIEQYISAKISTSFGEIDLQEAYATKGVATISCKNYQKSKLAVRVPEWCECFTAKLNGKIIEPVLEAGYAYFNVEETFVLDLDFGIQAVFMASNPNVRANVGRVALCYGPVVYCLEGVDNGDRLSRISVEISAVEQAKFYLDFHGLYSIEMDGFIDCAEDRLYFKATQSRVEKKRLKFIPFYAFANRGEADMSVWIRRK